MRLPTAQELLPHAEADARRTRNVILGVVGIPLLLLGLLGTAIMIGVGASGGSEGDELFVLLGIFVAVLLSGLAGVVFAIRRFRHDPALMALRNGGKVTDVQYSYLAQIRGHQTIANYTLSTGGTYSCFVPTGFPAVPLSQTPTAF
ncbi:MAG: hypothetical protein ACI9KE_004935 [Polyangiales bacterium]|jgi:hypothetical protein